MGSGFLERVYFGNTILNYLISTGIIIAGVIILKIVGKVSIHRIKAFTSRTKLTVDDLIVEIIERSVLPGLYLGIIYIALKRLTLTPILTRILDVGGTLVLSFFLIRAVVTLAGYGLERYWLKREQDENKVKSIRGIITVIKGVIWAGGIIFMLDNLGFNVSTVITGLGIGGVAVALAAQAVLGDLFAYFTIFFDKPFEIGDFIVVGDFMGTVEHIGIKSTRLRSISGEELVFSNKDLTNSRIKNFRRMHRRRVAFSIGVTYDTPLEKVKKIPVIIKDVIDGIDNATFDRAHFASYDDSWLRFEIVYYVESSDYYVYMDIQQKINLTLKEEFEKMGIEFAFPSQTIYLVNQGNG